METREISAFTDETLQIIVFRGSYEGLFDWNGNRTGALPGMIFNLVRGPISVT